MSISAQLDDLRASLPDCRLVVFGDLFSQITLCASSRDKYPQEQLDALCVTASNMLDGPVARSVSGALTRPDANTVDQAVLMGPSFVHLFLRSPVDKADVLCCVLSLNADVEKTTTQAHAALSRIARSQ